MRIREQNLRNLRKKNGLCLYCGKPNDRLPKTLCSACSKRHGEITHNRWLKIKNNPSRLKKQYELSNVLQKNYKNRIKKLAIEKYGGKCRCCNEREIIFLTIDHVNNDGNIERKTKHAFGVGFYRKLVKDKISERYQVLCRNCNWAKHVLGVCPHAK